MAISDVEERLRLGIARETERDPANAIEDAPAPTADDSTGPRTLQLDDGRWLEIATYPADLVGTVAEEPRASRIVVLRDVTRAREAETAREAFLGVLSHELRTPVTTIFGWAKVLQRPGRRHDRVEMLADIEVEADRLYRIVEDLLALTRVEGGIRVEGEPLLVQHLADSLVASEARRWPGITFEVGIPSGLPPVFGERTYVEQVLRNLVSNAGKYSPPGTVVTVEGEATADEVLVRVLDRGRGIDAEEADRLFDLYYRSTRTAKMADGAGIGLYVGRGLMTAMGGRIWARPRPGGGSEFGFSLPRCEDEPIITLEPSEFQASTSR
jgi:signal transduction histidine kinase